MFAEYFKAGYPFLWARTFEPERLIQYLVTGNELGNRNLGVWDAVRGTRTFVPASQGWTEFNQDWASPFDLVSKITTGPERTVWVLNNLQFFIGEPQVIQDILNNIGTLKAKGITLLATGASILPQGKGALPPELEREIHVLDFPLPDEKEIELILQDIESGTGLVCQDRVGAINAVKGLTWMEIENAFSWVAVKSRSFDPKLLTLVKAQMVEKNASLEFSRYTERFSDIGGLDYLKQWVLRRFQNKKTYLPLRGIMLLGIPGTGKSLFAQALANELGWAGLKLPMSAVFGGLVGESESKMRSALATVSAMSPCVLFIDEIDKGLAGVGGSSSDGGTTQRVGGIFLTWMQERKEDVFVIGTANDIRLLPTEYKRAGGRWDAIFFVDVPTIEERVVILELYLKKFQIETVMADKARAVLPKLLEGYTGAEIMQVCVEMGFGASPEEAADFVKPLVKSQPQSIESIRKQAESWVKATQSLTKPAFSVSGKRRITLNA